jgi:hypothetical protein
MPDHNPVSNPSHYLKFGISPQRLIEAYSLSFVAGNAVKYLCRADHKENTVQDLEKAVWYSMRAYEVACAKAEGREPIDIDNKKDPCNPFGLGFLSDLKAYQKAQQ